MDKQTIQTLNHLNQNFYSTVHESFDQTRSSAWAGWNNLIPFITEIATNQHKLSVLDVGCGNGRFLSFLTSFLESENLIFTGVDSSFELLQKAQKLHPEASFVHSDIVENLLKNCSVKNSQHNKWLNVSATTDPSTIAQDDSGRYDLITLFGVMHHIPSQNLRKQLIAHLATVVKNEGLLIVANWQFADDPRYKKRYVKPDMLSINAKDLEENDFILDWQKGKTAYRYCHHTSEKEMKEIVSQVNGEIIESFFADGKSGKLNQYYVISRCHSD